MHLCLFEDDQVSHLLPLTATRAVYDLRLGIRTLLETTRDAFDAPPMRLHARSFIDAVTAQENGLPAGPFPDDADVLFVNGRFIAEEGDLLDRLRRAGRPGEPARVFVQGEDVIAAWTPGASSRLTQTDAVTRATFDGLAEESVEGARLISRLWHLIDEIHPALARDFAACTKGLDLRARAGVALHPSAVLVGSDLYVAPGATISPGAVLNAEDGPVFIDAGARVMEQAVVTGPAYVGKHARVKIGGSVEGSVVGPVCKAGGEVENTVMHSYANKQHAGFLGHSYLGRWTNLAADTNNSDLKNTYGEVTLYDEATGAFEPSGRSFLGLFMGDHAKSGINTMFNTGTVVGVFCNVYGSGFQPRYLPAFTWGSPGHFVEYRLDKAFAVAEAVLARRAQTLTDAERAVLKAISEARTATT